MLSIWAAIKAFGLWRRIADAAEWVMKSPVHMLAVLSVFLMAGNVWQHFSHVAERKADERIIAAWAFAFGKEKAAFQLVTAAIGRQNAAVSALAARGAQKQAEAALALSSAEKRSQARSALADAISHAGPVDGCRTPPDVMKIGDAP